MKMLLSAHKPLKLFSEPDHSVCHLAASGGKRVGNCCLKFTLGSVDMQNEPEEVIFESKWPISFLDSPYFHKMILMFMVTDLNTQRVQRTKLNLQVLQSFGYSPTRGFKSRAEESISLDLINQLEAVDRPISRKFVRNVLKLNSSQELDDVQPPSPKTSLSDSTSYFHEQVTSLTVPRAFMPLLLTTSWTRFRLHSFIWNARPIIIKQIFCT